MKKVLFVLTCLIALFVNSCAIFICGEEEECRDYDSDTITIITH